MQTDNLQNINFDKEDVGKRKRQVKREGERDKERRSQRERDRHRYKKRDRHRYKERDRHRYKERDRDRETQKSVFDSKYRLGSNPWHQIDLH